MKFYFAMNRSGQYLDSNNLWTDDWPKARRSVTMPIHDEKVIGVHEMFEIEDTEAVGQQRPIKFRKMDTAEIQLILKFGLTADQLERMAANVRAVAPTKREAFLNELRIVAEQHKPDEFKPTVRYNETGDQLEVYIKDEPSHQRPVSVRAPGILLQIGMESKEIVGFKIQQFIERMSGADPSRAAIMIDLEFVNEICDIYQLKIDARRHTWTWKPYELEFFKKVRDLWPGQSQRFLQDLP